MLHDLGVLVAGGHCHWWCLSFTVHRAVLTSTGLGPVCVAPPRTGQLGGVCVGDDDDAVVRPGCLPALRACMHTAAPDIQGLS